MLNLRIEYAIKQISRIGNRRLYCITVIILNLLFTTIYLYYNTWKNILGKWIRIQILYYYTTH